MNCETAQLLASLFVLVSGIGAIIGICWVVISISSLNDEVDRIKRRLG